MLKCQPTIHRYRTPINNPFQPSTVRLEELEVDQVSRKVIYKIRRKDSNFKSIYSPRLKSPSRDHHNDEAMMNLKWTIYRNEAIDELLNMDGEPYFLENFNKLEIQEGYWDKDNGFTKVAEESIEDGKFTFDHKLKKKFQKFIRKWYSKLRSKFATKSKQKNSPTRERDTERLLRSPTVFSLSSFDETSEFATLSPEFFTPLRDLTHCSSYNNRTVLF